jgi:hypothetical protein
MTVEIRLKKKYRVGGWGRQNSPAGGNNRAARQHAPLTERDKALHAAQPVKVMHLQANGKCRMVTVQRLPGVG